MEANTFRIIKNGKVHIGKIIGYQRRKGLEDKFFLYMNVNEECYSIWYNNWFTAQEIDTCCDDWDINMNELLK